jgi:outer membrane PBP1 activator LpoA protein
MKLKNTRNLSFLAIAIVTAGCEMMYSDNANHARKVARANSAALATNKEASRQAAPAETVTGDALRLLLSGNSHVEEFRKAVTDAKPYFTT